ncbi:MAG TPA: hypothetical protein VNM40_01790 [Candidatus Paceibacterota bacterium]|nr:hypothetical protein [Candidatus Paceibacterota bacterium]
MDLLKHKHLFEASEKGSGEWKAFNVVRGDRVSAYYVSAPRISAPKTIRFGAGRLLVLKNAT